MYPFHLNHIAHPKIRYVKILFLIIFLFIYIYTLKATILESSSYSISLINALPYNLVGFGNIFGNDTLLSSHYESLGLRDFAYGFYGGI